MTRQHGFIGIEQPTTILRRADDLSPTAEQIRHEGNRRNEMLDHGAHQARGGRLQKDGGRDHGAVEGQLPGMVGDEQYAAGRRNVLDAEYVGAKVVAIEQARHANRAGQMLARHAKRIEAEFVLVNHDRLGAAFDVVTGMRGHASSDFRRRLLQRIFA